MSSPRRAAVLGFGRFGGALAQLLVEAGIELKAFDPSASIPAELAVSSLDALVTGASEIFVAVPVPSMHDAMLALRPHLTRGQLVLDVGSVKARPVEVMNEVLGDEIAWVATHPLFGPVSLSRAERPRHVVVCPNEVHPDAAPRARQLYELLGCDVIEADADTHDRVMADTHALTFFIAKAMLDIGAGEAPYAPPSFHAIARTIDLVRSDAGHLFAAIHRENPHAASARARLLRVMLDTDAALSNAAMDAPGITSLSSMASTTSTELREAREQIDEIDRELLDLLGRRAQISLRAGRAKAQLGRAVIDPIREAALLEARRGWASEHGLSADATEDVFRAVLRFSRAIQGN